MALTSLGGTAWMGQQLWSSGTPSFDTGGVINASGDRIALILSSEVALTIDQVAVSFGACATPATVSYRIETLSGSPDQPSGTLWNTNTNVTGLTPVANSVVSGTLTANASVSARTPFAVVIQSSSTPIDIIVNRLNPTNSAPYGGNYPYGANNLTGSYASVAMLACIGIHDTNLGWVCLNDFVIPIASHDSNAINTGTGATTGTRRGLRFSIPVPGRLSQLGPKISYATNADFDIILYDDGGSALQTMASITADTQRVSAGNLAQCYPLNPYELAANTFYRLAIVPTTANSVTLREFTVGSSMLSATPMGSNWQTTAFISSAWSEISNSQPWFQLGFDQLDNGVGSGGGKVIGAGF